MSLEKLLVRLAEGGYSSAISRDVFVLVCKAVGQWPYLSAKRMWPKLSSL